MRRRCAWLLLFAAACAAPGAPAAPLQDALAALLATPALAGGRIGVCVRDGDTGERLLGADDERGFATASNMKLVSAAVALTTLGPAHTAATEVWCRGELRDRVLHGDLVLRGHGDPTFGSGAAGRAQIAALVAAVRRHGIERVSGRVVGDDAWLGREHLGLGWQWDYLDEDYAAPFGGLCCAGNVVTVRLRAQDGRAVVVVEPPWYPVQSSVEVVPAARRPRLTAARPLGATTIEVRGAIAADAAPQVLRVPVPEPAAFAAGCFAAALREAGVVVAEAITTDLGADEQRLGEVTSPPFAEIVRTLLLHSDNLFAEVVARVAARIATGDGSTVALAAHVDSTLRGLGVDPAGMVVADASGLSRRNLVRPAQLAALLLAMHRSPHREAFAAGLPVAGESGTLRSRFTNGPARGRVRAKTGFISRVVCLSGYVPSPTVGAAPLVFSVMLNDFTCSDDEAKAAVDAFVQRLAAHAGW